MLFGRYIMIEVLKVLAGKVNGVASVTMTAMILIYLLGIATLVNNLFLCVGIITFMALFFIVAQYLVSKNKKDNTG
jgi:hypothetical protein